MKSIQKLCKVPVDGMHSAFRDEMLVVNLSLHLKSFMQVYSKHIDGALEQILIVEISLGMLV